MKSILYENSVTINQHISIKVPTLREVFLCEEEYYWLVNLLTAMPIDLMVMLDENGIDFTDIDEYQLFLLLFPIIANSDTSLIFGDLDLSNFVQGQSEQNGQTVMIDTKNDIVIDRGVYEQIAGTLRKIHHLEKNIKKPGNKEAKEFMLERAKKKAQRDRKREHSSQLELLIIATVNTEQFKYNFETVKDLTIYQFNESVRQIIGKINYDNRMLGVYTGNINSKELSQDDFNWFVHK